MSSLPFLRTILTTSSRRITPSIPCVIVGIRGGGRGSPPSRPLSVGIDTTTTRNHITTTSTTTRITRQSTAYIPQHSFSGLVDVLQGAEEGKTRITGYSKRGFIINGVEMEGSVIALPTMSLLWEARTLDDVTEDSLALLVKLDPPLEILLLGTGEEMIQPPVRLQKYCRKHGVVIEAMSSRHACGTFNFLNQEGRAVGAALLSLTPKPIDDQVPPSEQTGGATQAQTDGKPAYTLNEDEFGKPY